MYTLTACISTTGAADMTQYFLRIVFGLPSRVHHEPPTLIFLVAIAVTEELLQQCLTEVGKAQASNSLLVKRFNRHPRIFKSQAASLPNPQTHGSGPLPGGPGQFPTSGRLSLAPAKRVQGGDVDRHFNELMTRSILAVPPGSVVVAAGHSGTLYRIMAGLGVCVASKGESPQEGNASCLRFANASCFPRKEYDNLWVVIMGAGAESRATMVRLRYGDPVAVSASEGSA